jgi:hypothetical protein
MFILIYKKSTKHIVQVRNDVSTNPSDAQTWLNIYAKDNNLTADQTTDLTYAEIAPIEFGLIHGKHMWNESTQQVDEDPNYVAPTPTIPAEPTV